MEMEKLICIRYPHLFKPLQSVNAVILLIFLGSTTAVDGSGVLWFVTMVSLFVSTVATVIFMVDKNDPLILSMSNGILSWNIVEFIYSSILTILCAISFWLAFAYANHVPPEGHSTGYIFAGIFLIIQTVFYAVPAVLVYDRMRVAEEDVRVTHPFAKESENDSRYQSQQIV
ncbi:CBR-DRR-1 protein [Ditylenchus destructor]|uniref:CBR-DRR-1 protein n=1 Tax=Ditylenchus destructor TaxID=166010 RepID=A0AAD4R2Z1_9BILA|nr:CBR-DRR-1 protein [Ditylenchus destructor]